ncbi:MAG: HD domain-containing protein [Lachnospiraceae bacterium]|nr:HD domain-containing protein [Lachnospiraceae bacterium]
MDKLITDRKKIIDEFASYTSNYDISDEKIRLKVEHTYRVAGLCDRIARSLGMAEDDINMAWAIGMLHDIGRFDQIRQYGTFSDEDSVDHAHYATELLFGKGMIADYFGSINTGVYHYIENGSTDGKGLSRSLDIIKKAIYNHSAYRIEEGLDEREVLFCNIIRDADKLDIFKVVNDTPLENIYSINKEEISTTEVTGSVMQALREKHAVLRSLKKTPADYIAAYIALAFELVFPESFYILKEQGYLDNLLDFKTDNQDTKQQFQEIRKIIEEHITEKTK